MNAKIQSKYGEKVMDHYDNPRNVGSLDKNDKNVGTGLVGSPACGDVIKLQIKVDPKSKIITDVKFKTYGCSSAIASSSLATQMIKNKHINDILTIRNIDIASTLSLPPIKIHCSVLAEDVIRAAVNDYITKQTPE